jgi:hypothetical protein
VVDRVRLDNGAVGGACFFQVGCPGFGRPDFQQSGSGQPGRARLGSGGRCRRRLGIA